MAPRSRVSCVPQLGGEELIHRDGEIAVGRLHRRGGLIAVVWLVAVTDHVALEIGVRRDSVAVNSRLRQVEAIRLRRIVESVGRILRIWIAELVAGERERRQMASGAPD